MIEKVLIGVVCNVLTSSEMLPTMFRTEKSTSLLKVRVQCHDNSCSASCCLCHFFTKLTGFEMLVNTMNNRQLTSDHLCFFGEHKRTLINKIQN